MADYSGAYQGSIMPDQSAKIAGLEKRIKELEKRLSKAEGISTWIVEVPVYEVHEVEVKTQEEAIALALKKPANRCASGSIKAYKKDE